MQQPDQKSMFERLSYLENQLKELQRENSILTKENSQLRNFLKTIPQMISFIDKDLTYQFVNEAYEKFFHLRTGSIIGRRVPDLLGTKAFQDIKVHIEKALSGKEVKYLTEISYFNGPKYIEGQLFPEFNADRSVAGYYAILSDVTHHVESRNKLKESESRLRYFAAHAQDLMWSTDLDLKVTYVNHYSKALIGWEPHELMQLGVEKMFPFNTLTQILPYYRQKLKEVKSGEKLAGPINLEVELLHKNGNHIWAEMKADFIFNDEGKPTGVNGITRNIEARKKAEIKLKENEELYRLLLKNTTDAVYLTDEAGNFNYVSPGEDVIFGYRQEEILEKQNISILFARDFTADIKTALESGKKSIRTDMKTGEGKEKKLLLIIKKVDIKSSKLLFACRDISDLEEARKALSHKESQYVESEERRTRQQQLMENAEEMAGWGSWEWNIKEDAFVLSHGWRKIHDYYDDDLNFADVEKLIHPEDLPMLKKTVEKAVSTGGQGEVEVRVLTPGVRDVRYVKSTGKVTLDKNGVPVRMIGYVRDITEQKQTEKELRQKISEYEKLLGSSNSKPDKAELKNGFYTRILEKHPGLTQHELEHCAYIRQNFSTKKIADLFGIQAGSVQKSRVRLKKKLSLDQNLDLRSYLHKI